MMDTSSPDDFGVGPNDIICSRNSKVHRNPGNQRYNAIIQEHREAYQTTQSRDAKVRLTRTVLQTVQDYGGRFLKLDEDRGEWEEIDATAKREKVSHALRTALDPQLRKRRPKDGFSTFSGGNDAGGSSNKTNNKSEGKRSPGRREPASTRRPRAMSVSSRRHQSLPKLSRLSPPPAQSMLGQHHDEPPSFAASPEPDDAKSTKRKESRINKPPQQGQELSRSDERTVILRGGDDRHHSQHGRPPIHHHQRASSLKTHFQPPEFSATSDDSILPPMIASSSFDVSAFSSASWINSSHHTRRRRVSDFNEEGGGLSQRTEDDVLPQSTSSSSPAQHQESATGGRRRQSSPGYRFRHSWPPPQRHRRDISDAYPPMILSMAANTIGDEGFLLSSSLPQETTRVVGTAATDPPLSSRSVVTAPPLDLEPLNFNDPQAHDTSLIHTMWATGGLR